jgi:heme-degrading monooxygenase HmoA
VPSQGIRDFYDLKERDLAEAEEENLWETTDDGRGWLESGEEKETGKKQRKKLMKEDDAQRMVARKKHERKVKRKKSTGRPLPLACPFISSLFRQEPPLPERLGASGHKGEER